MRSRYSAYVVGDASYIAATWHSSTRDACEGHSADQSPTVPTTQWISLTILNTDRVGERAIVEFVARYKTGGRAHRLHEISRFVREHGRWFYVDGSFPLPETS
jgi:SEC-C motif-containing protein